MPSCANHEISTHAFTAGAEPCVDNPFRAHQTKIILLVFLGQERGCGGNVRVDQCYTERLIGIPRRTRRIHSLQGPKRKHIYSPW